MIKVKKIITTLLLQLFCFLFASDDPLNTSFESTYSDSSQINNQILTSIIPQCVFRDLEATKTVDGIAKTYTIFQRDCVENLIRNLLNMAFLYPDGALRPGVKEKLDQCPTLSIFYTEHTAEELIDKNPELLGKKWLDITVGFEEFGVQYAQSNRELLTGIDNILAVMAGLIPPIRTEKPSDSKAIKLKHICDYLSSETLNIVCNTKISSNYQDVTLTFNTKAETKIRKEKVKLLINTEHVCITHRNEKAC